MAKFFTENLWTNIINNRKTRWNYQAILMNEFKVA